MSATPTGWRDPRRLILGLGLFVALAAWLMPPDTKSEQVVRLGSHRTGPTGGRALFLTAESLGLEPTAWTAPWTDLRGRESDLSLLVLAPTVVFDKDEERELLRFVRRGGRALWVPSGINLFGERADKTLRELLELRLRNARKVGDDPDVRARRSSDLSPQAQRVLGDSSRELRGVRRALEFRGGDEDAPGDEAAELADGVEIWIEDGAGRAVLARWAYGQGELFFVSELDGLANLALGAGDLGPVMLRLMAELGRDRELGFDDFHHGVRAGRGPGPTILAYLKTHALGLSVLGWLLLSLFGLWAAGVRYGPPQPPPPATRRSSLEHARALGHAYALAHATELPAERLAEGARRRLAPLTMQAAVARARELGVDPQRLDRLRRQLSHSPPDVQGADALAQFALDLDHLEASLAAASRPPAS